VSGQNQAPIANQQYSPQVPPSLQSNDEIDLRELFKALWDGKVIIVVSTIVFAVAAILFALKQPNIYQSQASFVLEEVFYGSLEISEPLISPQFLSSSELKSLVSAEVGVDAKVLSDVSVFYDKKNKSLSISQISTNPQIAFDNVTAFSLALNRALKQSELVKVQASINAFKHQENVYSSKTQEYLDELLGQQLFKESLLKSPSSKLVTQTSKAIMPTSHIKPKRALIGVLGTLLGGMLGVAIVLIRFAFRREEG